MEKRKIAIVGSRTYPLPKHIWDNMELEAKDVAAAAGREFVKRFISHLSPSQHVVVSGGAEGVDSWAAEFAEERGITVVVIRPNWKKYGRGAGFKRNTEIVLAGDDVIAFWDGKSQGTLDSVKKAHKTHKPYCIFGPDGLVKVAVTEETYAEEAVAKVSVSDLGEREATGGTVYRMDGSVKVEG